MAAWVIEVAPAISVERAIVRAAAPAWAIAAVSTTGVLAAVIASATAVWAAARRWVIAAASVAGPEVLAAVLPVPAACVVLPAWGEPGVAAVFVVVVAVAAPVVVGGGKQL